MSTSAFGRTPHSRRMRLGVAFLSLVLASSANYLLSSWLGFPRTANGYIGIYRRVGPESGPQALCAGSSLLVWGLDWSKVSEALGQGIETWGVGGSSPDIWEEWQKRRPLSNTTIIGVSVYDLNEMHLADERAMIVPLSRTMNDLWASGAESSLWHRVLSQYTVTYVRLLFPTAGKADRVLEGLRSKAAAWLGRQASLEEHEGLVVEPRAPLLDAGESTAKVSDWTPARLIRRIASFRSENSGRHDFFKGPKSLAFHRLLVRAQQQGSVIVVVLPVTRAYTEAFLGDGEVAAFERAMDEATAIAPEATFVRLDRLPGISDPGNFFDLVHMNSFGRRQATAAFLMELAKKGTTPKIPAASAVSMSAGDRE